ncbi:hypothetical protein AAHA92_02461 [Salvia divinorum]|uniref:Uncharacterized protein n=1 Tax=Salvia divinorum TaxID=28513 RepID=A0ABD1II17_SALDI
MFTPAFILVTNPSENYQALTTCPDYPNLSPQYPPLHYKPLQRSFHFLSRISIQYRKSRKSSACKQFVQDHFLSFL